jgi:excisionase family DNA binding protein
VRIQPGEMPDYANDSLLRPREVARIFGVRTTTIARWAREGALPAVVTPGGHRRYRWSEIRLLFNQLRRQDPAREELAQDAVRLYEQGWSIRQVAEKFDLDYGVMRRILMKGTTLRDRGARTG